MSEEGANKRELQAGKSSSALTKYSKEDFHDRYHLADGGFSKVCRYSHEDLKMVAIKEFNITGDDKTIKKTQDMVKRETYILSRFHHENIVKILGITEWSNAVGIVMEYVDGGNLTTLLSETNQSELAWETRLEIAQGIISALSYIHNFDEKKNFCHGDIKPDNILLTKTHVVKMADFGSAALQLATGASKSASEIVPTTQYTLYYAAPEFLKDITLPKNPAMDIFSFGSVLYELISTKPPYGGYAGHPCQLKGLIVTGNKPDMKLIDQAEEELQTDRDRLIYNSLKKLMLRCWNDDPASRPDSKTVKEKVDGYLKKLQQDTSFPDHKIELTADEAAAYATHQDKDVGGNVAKNDQHQNCDVTPAPSIPQTFNPLTQKSLPKKNQMFSPSFSSSSKNKSIAENFNLGTPFFSSIPLAPALGKLTQQDENESSPTSSVTQSSLEGDESSTAFDSVSSQNDDQSSNQEISAAAKSKSETSLDKFSKRVRQFSKDEFKVRDQEDSFIGSGSYGDVIKYDHKDQVVAIKEFAVKGDEETITEIWNTVLREANILCRFDHENIVKILGVTQWEKGIGIVMEFVNGGNVLSLLEKPDFSWNTRLEIAKGITSGLEYLHNYGEKKAFCHGDLKPENVLLTQSLQVKLADFGSAAFYRATGASATTIDVVSTKQFTLVYAAPEFLKDNTREKNPAMDMFSFGMVLYELISGKAPYSDSTMSSVVPALILGGIKPTQKLIDEAKGQLKSDDDRSTFDCLRNVMERCWNNDPTSRPSSKTVKHTLSGEWKNTDKFSNRVRQYSKDEFKVRNKEDSFIGSGGYGDVRKYDHKDQAVAMKEFAVKGDQEGIDNIWKMVLHEANILCRFDHENVVKILGVTQWEKGVGIVMEFVDGGNLQKLLSKDNQSELSWKSRLDIAKEITSGLEYIHNYGEKKTFCHGDLKPANILLTKKLQVKLADFGSAAFYRATSASATTINNVSTKQFTLIYVAPEFLQDNTQTRMPTMDMYSFGMVLFELISGKPPYSDCTMPNFLSALIAAIIKPSEKLIDKAKNQLKSDDDRSVFNLLRSLMNKCCDKDPASRPSSKAVQQELSGDWRNQKQSSSSPVHQPHKDSVDPFASKRKSAAAPTMEKPTRYKAAKRLAPKSNIRHIWSESERPSTSKAGMPKQSSRGSAMRKKMSNTTNIVSQTFSGKTNPGKSWKASGRSTIVGSNVSVQDHLTKYTNLLLNDHFGQAENCKKDLRSLLVNSFQATAEELKQFGEKLQDEGKYLHSMAIFDISSALFAEMKNPSEDLEGIQYCVQGMRSACKVLIDNDANMKVIAREHVIPLMRNWLHEVQRTSQVSDKWKCHAVSWIFSNIEVCEMLTDQSEKRMETLEEAVDGMSEVFGDEVYKQLGRLYGNLLNHLAGVYLNYSRFNDAAKLFEEAAKAQREAVDYFGDEAERQRDIHASENNVRGCMKAAWEEDLQR